MAFKTLYDFKGGSDGADTGSGPIFANGALYGTTGAGGGSGCERSGCGTVYRVTTTGKETILHRFSDRPDGAEPLARLTYVDGALYGTTDQGGANNGGTVFKVTMSGTETVLHSFGSGSDGKSPRGGVVYANGMLYGTTAFGGTSNDGTIFSMTTSGTETVLYSFAGGSDGAVPLAGLLAANEIFYGTTAYGGVVSCRTNGIGCGTIFSITTSGTESIVYRFQGGSDGQTPAAGVIILGGTLYGTTESGGAGSCGGYGCGTVFSLTGSGLHSVLHIFGGGSDGLVPASHLTAAHGILYGTTEFGGGTSGCGGESCGTIYSITTSGTESVIYTFTGGADGAVPQDLTIDVNGKLYGAAEDYGNCIDCGAVFSLTL